MLSKELGVLPVRAPAAWLLTPKVLLLVLGDWEAWVGVQKGWVDWRAEVLVSGDGWQGGCAGL